MTYRGPDDSGVWVSASGECTLAHRRLSVIDLSESGRQPLPDESGATWVSLNGELYNFRALRSRLSAEGHQFRTHTDTEILPHLFEDLNPDRIQDLDGMYAFAIWSETSKRLLMARDPFGKKPLYYCEGPGCFAFASELQALRHVPGFDITIDRDALSLYLFLQYVPAPHTFFVGAKNFFLAITLSWTQKTKEDPEFVLAAMQIFDPTVRSRPWFARREKRNFVVSSSKR